MVILPALLLCGIFAGAKPTPKAPSICSARTLSAKLDAILTSPGIGEIYGRDGAAAGSIARTPMSNDLGRLVDELLRCGERAVPLLVDHLDDVRPTSALADGEPVPAGFVCLDLLVLLSDRPSPAFLAGCETDGPCACLTYGFCFDANGFDIWVDTGEDVVVRPSPKPAEVKQNWRSMIKSGAPHFGYPAFLDLVRP